jgi:hypothetical protein
MVLVEMKTSERIYYAVKRIQKLEREKKTNTKQYETAILLLIQFF